MCAHVICELGRGSFGTVQCWSRKNTRVAHGRGENLAVKIFYKKECFENELRCAREIGAHPNIVTFLASAQGLSTDGHWRGHIFMEVATMDLHTYVFNGKPTDVTKKVRNALTLQMLRGLQHMHKSSVAHLDIKPENCLLMERYDPMHKDSDDEGMVLEAMWADFGLSRILSPTDHSICERNGSWKYVAPEIIAGRKNGAPYDAMLADMWSFGMTVLIFTHTFPWSKACEGDAGFARFLANGQPVVWSLGSCYASSVLSHTLHADPKLRKSCDYILMDIELVHPLVTEVAATHAECIRSSA